MLTLVGSAVFAATALIHDYPRKCFRTRFTQGCHRAEPKPFSNCLVAKALQRRQLALLTGGHMSVHPVIVGILRQTSRPPPAQHRHAET